MKDDEALGMFLEEALEYFSEVDELLLQLDQNPKNPQDALNKIFRAAHSLKGGAGFFSYLEPLQIFAHKVENLLDKLRNGDLNIDSKVVNLLLQCFDLLKAMCSDAKNCKNLDTTAAETMIESMQKKTPRFIAEEHVHTAIQAHKKEKVASKLFPSDMDLEIAKRDDSYIYHLRLDLLSDLEKHKIEPLPFLVELEESGTVLQKVFNPDQLGDVHDDSNSMLFEILWKTPLSIRDASSHLQIPESCFETVFDPSSHEGTHESQSTVVTETKPVSEPKSTTLRVNIELMDLLMDLAGELVLSRNQIAEALESKNLDLTKHAFQKLSQVVTGMQETVMQTRLQAIGLIFHKFPRFVRTLALETGKLIDLQISGNEVEMDKSIIESLADPLMHMIRNAVDHGIEKPSDRQLSGKSETGKIRLHACHEAGQVVIELRDDGAGIHTDKLVKKAIERGVLTPEKAQQMSEKEKFNLIFAPGLSTAEKVSDLSGRGVGMDVVKHNLDALGGKIEIESNLKKGTCFRIKLPLTLAIIPSLIVSVGEHFFALPQMNVDELIRIHKEPLNQQIDFIGDYPVLKLRGELIPLADLSELLHLGATPKWKKHKNSLVLNEDFTRFNIAILSSGTRKCGIFVDKLFDTVEIVVKPLGSELKHLVEYAGATIMGNGEVAMILDVGGLFQTARLSEELNSHIPEEDSKESQDEIQTFLSFKIGKESCLIPLSLVQRVERVVQDRIETAIHENFYHYEDRTMPLIPMHHFLKQNEKDLRFSTMIVFKIYDKEVGFLANNPVETIEGCIQLDSQHSEKPGVMGMGILNSKVYLFLDIFQAVDHSFPQWKGKITKKIQKSSSQTRLALAEDSDFLRTHIKNNLVEEGFFVKAFEHGKACFNWLEKNSSEVDLVISDLEMPVMDGFELAKQIRANLKTAHLPLIALTSLVDKKHVLKAKESGFDDYQVKFDKGKLLGALSKLIALKSEEARD